MTLHVPFDNSYARLPDRFYTRLAPTPVKSPGLIRINTGLAEALGIDPQALAAPEGLAMLAGNHIPEGAEPLAQTYAGHQFGGWNPQLGDGRAILLGEVTDQTGLRRDIQLKGSGPTPYSRMGDGRAWVGPVLREYIVSEAMHALGIPTTRALAAVTTGEVVLREGAFPGAVFARVAASHIRVGTFQFFFARQDTEALGLLLAHIAERHYPDSAPEPLAILDAVVARQAELIAKWMGVGFIHGVMNTDNMTLSGETIDYGPCAFLDTYHPETVFSSIDQFGRYAYQNQPQIAHWNLAQFATTLLPLMGNDDAAVAAATEAINRFPDLYKAAWEKVFRAKIGLTTVQDGDTGLVTGLLDAMTAGRADFTNTFRGLATGTARLAFEMPEAYDDWAAAWRKRLAEEPGGLDAARTRLMQVNPAIIPRNHQVEAAIAAALNGDYAVFHALTEALQTPFTDAPAYAAPPQADEVVQQTFCGT